MTLNNKISIVLLFFFTGVFAQDTAIDSLKLVLKTGLNDTTRCNVLAQLVELENDETIWPLYNEELKTKCESSLQSASTSSSLKRFYLKHLASALNNAGFLADQKGNVAEALKYFLRSLELKEQTGDKRGAAISLSNIGVIYDDQGDTPKAIEYYLKSLKLLEETGDKKGAATILNNLGTIYDNQGNIPLALKYYEQSLHVCEQIRDKDGIGIALNNIGFIYVAQKNISKGLEFYTRSLRIREELNDELGIATSLNNLGFVYKNMGDTTKALQCYKQSLTLSEKINNKESICYSLNNLATTLLQQKKFKDAIKLGERSLNLAKALGYPRALMDVSNALSKAYAVAGNWKNAYEMQVLFKQMSDGISSEKNKKASLQKTFEYEYEKKTLADNIRTSEERKVHEAQLKQEKTQRFALYGGLVLVGAFSVFIFNRFRLTKRQKAIIEDQKLEVDHAYEQLNEKNKEVLDSIHYARRIQKALITSEKYMQSHLSRLKRPPGHDKS